MYKRQILSIMMVAFTTVMPKFKILQKLMDGLNSVVREMLDGMPVSYTHLDVYKRQPVDYMNTKEFVEFKNQPDGTISIQLKNITHITSK